MGVHMHKYIKVCFSVYSMHVKKNNNEIWKFKILYETSKKKKKKKWTQKHALDARFKFHVLLKKKKVDKILNKELNN